MKNNEENKKTLGIVSLVLSILGIFVFGIPLGIVSIILGALSWETSFGKAGFIIGIIDIVGVLLLFA